MNSQPIHDAATIILLRDSSGGPHVLLGKRGVNAAFMPNKFVFPGGRVDTNDWSGQFRLVDDEMDRLGRQATRGIAPALVAAARRELAEETGLQLSHPESMRFIFRAITPPGRPRRFDARFFLAPTSALSGDPDDFTAASDELSDLTWVPIRQACRFDLPFITEVVLAEVEAIHKSPDIPRAVPFFFHNDGNSRVIAL